jgi:hypothetical protein
MEIIGPQGLYSKISSYSWLGDFISYAGFKKLIYGYLIFLLVVCYFLVCLNSLKRVWL